MPLWFRYNIKHVALYTLFIMDLLRLYAIWSECPMIKMHFWSAKSCPSTIFFSVVDQQKSNGSFEKTQRNESFSRAWSKKEILGNTRCVTYFFPSLQSTRRKMFYSSFCHLSVFLCDSEQRIRAHITPHEHHGFLCSDIRSVVATKKLALSFNTA